MNTGSGGGDHRVDGTAEWPYHGGGRPANARRPGGGSVHGIVVDPDRRQLASMIVRRGIQTIALAGVIVAFVATPAARADNKRLNDAVVANVYTAQHQAGCTNDVKINPQLQLAAEWHAKDVLNNRNLVDDIGSDGSGPQDRANAAGFHGQVGETVAINPAAAISGVELINQWYYNPAHFAIMSNCANSQIGVWSENSPDRTVVVAVYGRPQQLVDPPRRRAETSPMAAAPGQSENIPLDPSPDYDASDELEFGISWFPWILRGVYPPPAHPPE